MAKPLTPAYQIGKQFPLLAGMLRWLLSKPYVDKERVEELSVLADKALELLSSDVKQQFINSLTLALINVIYKGYKMQSEFINILYNYLGESERELVNSKHYKFLKNLHVLTRADIPLFIRFMHDIYSINNLNMMTEEDISAEVYFCQFLKTKQWRYAQSLVDYQFFFTGEKAMNFLRDNIK